MAKPINKVTFARAYSGFKERAERLLQGREPRIADRLRAMQGKPSKKPSRAMTVYKYGKRYKTAPEWARFLNLSLTSFYQRLTRHANDPIAYPAWKVFTRFDPGVKGSKHPSPPASVEKLIIPSRELSND